jgi:hypothetical protein
MAKKPEIKEVAVLEQIAPADDANPNSTIPEQSLNAPNEDVQPATEGAEVPDEPAKPAPADPITDNYLGEPTDRKEPKPVADDLPEEDEQREFIRPFRSGLVHFTGERVTVGDGVADALARGEAPENIYLPSLGKEVPASQFKFVSDGTDIV